MQAILLGKEEMRMMSLQEKLNRFKHQQEKCQATPAAVAAQASSSKSVQPHKASHQCPASTSPAPGKASAAIKFSSDTERLQLINHIRKAPVGAQIKCVIELLRKTRLALTPKQINEACYVDVNSNTTVFSSLKNNPKVFYDGKHFLYKVFNDERQHILTVFCQHSQGIYSTLCSSIFLTELLHEFQRCSCRIAGANSLPKHYLMEKEQLLSLIRKFPEGLAILDIKDAYPSVMEDLQALKAAGQVWLLSNTYSQRDAVYPNDPKVEIKVDDDLKQLFHSIELPQDMLDMEKDLVKSGMKPAMNTANRQVMAQVHTGVSQQVFMKQRGIRKRRKITNIHLPELIRHLNLPGT